MRLYFKLSTEKGPFPNWKWAFCDLKPSDPPPPPRRGVSGVAEGSASH
jgi:hypothetical protein